MKNKTTYEVLMTEWLTEGTASYKGLLYKRGVNDSLFDKMISKLKDDGKYITTMGDLAHRFDDLMRVPPLGSKHHEDGPPAKGFSIGNGKLLYWYVTPFANTGTYRAIQEGYESKRVSIRYGIISEQLVTVHY